MSELEERAAFLVNFKKGKANYARWIGEAPDKASAIETAKGDLAASWDVSARLRGSDARLDVDALLATASHYGLPEGTALLAVAQDYAMRTEILALGEPVPQEHESLKLLDIAQRDPGILKAVLGDSDAWILYESSIGHEGLLQARAEILYPSHGEALQHWPKRETLVAMIAALTAAEGAYPRDDETMREIAAKPESATLRAALKARLGALEMVSSTAA